MRWQLDPQDNDLIWLAHPSHPTERRSYHFNLPAGELANAVACVNACSGITKPDALPKLLRLLRIHLLLFHGQSVHDELAAAQAALTEEA